MIQLKEFTSNSLHHITHQINFFLKDKSEKDILNIDFNIVSQREQDGSDSVYYVCVITYKENIKTNNNE